MIEIVVFMQQLLYQYNNFLTIVKQVIIICFDNSGYLMIKSRPTTR